MKIIIFILIIFTTFNMQGQVRDIHIGDTISCGLVFYVEKDSISGRQRGLVCALVDQDSIWHQQKGVPWDSNIEKKRFIRTNAVRDSLFSKANADNILLKLDSGIYAASVAQSAFGIDRNCVDTNWYLPSIAELKLMFNNLAVNRNLGNFAQEGYWSSVEWRPQKGKRKFNYAYIWDFWREDGKNNPKNPMKIYKSNHYHVRAVRVFFK